MNNSNFGASSSESYSGCRHLRQHRRTSPICRTQQIYPQMHAHCSTVDTNTSQNETLYAYHHYCLLHFLSNWPAFPELLHLSHTHKRITFNIPGADLLWTGCTSCCPTNSVRALKDLYLETCKFTGEHDRFHRPGHTVSSQCTLDSCHQETFPGSFSSTLQFLLYRLHESQLASPYQIHLQHTSHSRNQSNIFHLPIQYKWLISTKHYKHLLY